MAPCRRLAVFLLAIGFLHWSPAVAAEVGVTECDRLAAHPDDHQRAAGVDGMWIPAHGDFPAAVTACEEAIQRHPDVARFKYQYARALHAWSEDCLLVMPMLEAAAEEGHAAAAYRIGVCHLNGRGMRRDEEAMVAWYRRAADLGSPSAVARLAKLVGWGTHGYARNEAQALRIHQELAARGNIEALRILKESYWSGIFWLEKSLPCAFGFLDLAARRGHPDSLYRMAHEFLEPKLGSTPDLGRAHDYMQRAAEAGYARAQAELPALAERLEAEQPTRLPHGKAAGGGARPKPQRQGRGLIVCDGFRIQTR